MDQAQLENRLIDAEVKLNRMSMSLLRARVTSEVLLAVAQRTDLSGVNRKDVEDAAAKACSGLVPDDFQQKTVSDELKKALDDVFAK
jgi:hypothetical protein